MVGMNEEDELEAIRRRKLEQLQRQQVEQVVSMERAMAAEAQRQAVLRQILTPEARQRLARITLAYPDLATGVENQLISLAQSGRVRGIIDDAALREILRRLLPERRDIKIERR
jgi:programmed cell death protein 5